jgi:hypothetical protein
MEMIAKGYITGLNSLCRRNCRRTKRFSNLPEMGFVYQAVEKLLRGWSALLLLAQKLNVLQCTPHFFARLRRASQPPHTSWYGKSDGVREGRALHAVLLVKKGGVMGFLFVQHILIS